MKSMMAHSINLIHQPTGNQCSQSRHNLLVGWNQPPTVRMTYKVKVILTLQLISRALPWRTCTAICVFNVQLACTGESYDQYFFADFVNDEFTINRRILTYTNIKVFRIAMYCCDRYLLTLQLSTTVIIRRIQKTGSQRSAAFCEAPWQPTLLTK